MSSSSPRALSEKFSGGRVKGGMVRAHLDWIRHHHGEEGLLRVTQQLPEAVAHEIATALPSSWVPFQTLVALDKAIAETFGPDALRDMGRFSAEQNLATTYRIYKRDDIHEFFRRSASLHLQFQDFGAAEYEQTGPQSGQMKHSGYTTYSPAYCASALGYYQEAIAIHGGNSPTVTETSCTCAGDKACVFEMHWV